MKAVLSAVQPIRGSGLRPHGGLVWPVIRWIAVVTFLMVFLAAELVGVLDAAPSATLIRRIVLVATGIEGPPAGTPGWSSSAPGPMANAVPGAGRRRKLHRGAQFDVALEPFFITNQQETSKR